MTIPVIWTEGPQGGIHGRSGYACCTQLNQMFDLYNCQHWSGVDNYPEGLEGAVVVVHGGNERMRSRLITEIIRSLKWVLLITIGDESADFPHDQIKHPNLLRWIQTPRPGGDVAERYLLCGWPNDCQEFVAKVGDRNKYFDYFFAGQMTHSRRWELGVALQSLPNGMFVPTQGFGQGLGHEEYYRVMVQSRVVPCPAGPATPDTYRMCEALEAGAVPVLDAASIDGREGYWDLVLPNHPFTVLQNWSDFPPVMNSIWKHWPRDLEECQAYWSRYKEEFNNWLGEDLRKLGAL